MLWSLLFILLIGAPKCLEVACKCTNGELSCPQTGGQMCHGECKCPDGTPIGPERGACQCSNGEPKCPGGVFMCPEEFPFSQPESNWISSQSSDYERRNAEKAVDKNKKSCTKTQKEENSWWMIDLKDVYDISSIAIYNKDDKDISGAQIYIGNCPENNSLTNELVKNITDFQMDCWNVYQTNRLGRYITVYLPKKHLVLCEVRINATKKESPTCLKDADFCQPNDNWITSQSSDYTVTLDSKRAIDGNKTLCAHTKEINNSWWMIDLKGVYDISSIAIYNNNHHNIHMEGARIHIGYSCKNNGTDNKLVKNIKDFTKDCWNVYQTDTSGRYITVSLPKKKHLILCEVRINAKRKHSPFELITQNKTWENALEYCRAKDKDLASILDEEDQAWAELEATKADTPFVWLGLHYTCVLEFWFWVADHPLGFHHWAPNNKKEECDISVAMKTTEDHQWFSKHVNDKFNFLCEK